jgi:hypothetical protein
MREPRAQIPDAAPLLAYPHGRNDAGTDRFELRRVELKEWDGPAAVTWKALTGELVPWAIERRRLKRRARRSPGG